MNKRFIARVKGATLMQAAVLAALFALGAVPDAGAAAESENSLSVEDILSRNAEARGGVKAWRQVETLTMSGKMDAGRIRPVATGEIREVSRGRVTSRTSAIHVHHGKPPTAATSEEKVVQLPFSLEMKRPRKMRLELKFDGKTAVQVYDGTHGWKKRPWLADPMAQPYTEQEERTAAQDQEIDGFLIDHAAKGTQVALEGREKVNGADAYKLKLTLKTGDVRHVWVDARSFLETQVDGKRRMDGKDKTVLTTLADYRKVDGVLLPFEMKTQVEGVPAVQRIQLDSVAVNEPVADADFFKP